MRRVFEKFNPFRCAAARRRRPGRPRLTVEALEARFLPAGSYLQTNLVADLPGVARVTDPNLVNPWGIVPNPTGFWWVANNGTGLSTQFDGAGQLAPPGTPPVVTIPPAGGSAAHATPTGIVFNGSSPIYGGSSNFMVTQGGNSGASVFIFATEDGTISGWSPQVNFTNAILAVDNSASGAVYKGLALGTNSTGTFLFAANFHAGTVDVFNSSFAPATLPGSFADPNLPAGFAPFNIANVNGNLFVTYAQQNATKHTDVPGPGKGFVDEFDTNGNLMRRFASQGPLNAPWAVVLAPANFGAFSNDLLVGNFGDGRISAFDPNSGAFRGQLTDAKNQPITLNGLWGLAFGAGTGSQTGSSNTLFFAAGPNFGHDGLFGSLQAINPVFVTGADAGGGPQVNVFDAATGALKFSFFAYAPGFTGGVRVAVGDVNGDGVPDIVTAPGPGGGPDIHVYDGNTGQLIRQFFAFSPNFTGGSYVATGDVNGDGFADIIIGADQGGGPDVTVVSGKDESVLSNFFAYAPGFTGGVRVAAGDVNGDGKAEIITGAGPGGGPNVTVLSVGATGAALPQQSFFAFAPGFGGGVYVAAGDVNGDGKADVIVGAGPGGGPDVTVFDGGTAANILSFFPFDQSFAGGVRVASTERSGTSQADVVAVPGPSGGPDVETASGLTGQQLDSFFAVDPKFTGGLFVAG